MTPDLLFAAIKSVADCGTEFLKFIQTPEGQAWAKEQRENRAEFEKWAQGVGDWIEKLFTGKLIEGKS